MKKESRITIIVYTMVCRRVGQATCRSSPRVSLRYWRKDILDFVSK